MKDLEFHVELHDTTRVLTSFKKAVELAAIHSIGQGRPVNVDVIVYSKAAARAFGGDGGVETYLEDPDASVFQRIQIKAEDLGRIR